MAQANPDHNHHVSEGDVKAPNILERAKEEIDAIMHSAKPHHHGETHGTSPEIDQNTPVDEVKAPNIFERAKEEVEAIVEAIHPKKESDHNSSSDKEGGFWGFLARSENDEDAKEAAESHKRESN
ncbi:hypothetical protein H6P81_000146 [Aristolochia fimbriata]|uniref:Uncharacterized protein n=1 Tax=Aristolochia fimbriata TaxID=158543 RepID=A0AAV7F3Q0_ARIFI|nr:hypothetical protein H6P81_000146 [Aristolochia fimbriata]